MGCGGGGVQRLRGPPRRICQRLRSQVPAGPARQPWGTPTPSAMFCPPLAAREAGAARLRWGLFSFSPGLNAVAQIGSMWTGAFATRASAYTATTAWRCALNTFNIACPSAEDVVVDMRYAGYGGGLKQNCGADRCQHLAGNEWGITPADGPTPWSQCRGAASCSLPAVPSSTHPQACTANASGWTVSYKCGQPASPVDRPFRFVDGRAMPQDVPWKVSDAVARLPCLTLLASPHHTADALLRRLLLPVAVR